MLRARRPDACDPADGSGGGLHTSQYYINLWLKFSKKRDLLFSYNCLHLLNYTVPNSLFFPKAPFYCFVPNTGNTLSGGKHKQWPQEHWIKLGEALVQRGYTVVWLGGKEDHNWIPERAGFDIRMGNIYFQEIAVLMKKSKGVIAGDTGLFHLALALNVNAFGLYGPSSPTIVGPFRSPHGITIAKSELPCIHCMQLTCTHPEATKNMAYCLQLIKPEEVIQLLDLNFQ